MPEVLVKFKTIEEAHAVAELLRISGALKYRRCIRGTKTIRVRKYPYAFVVDYNYVNTSGRSTIGIKALLNILGTQ